MESLIPGVQVDNDVIMKAIGNLILRELKSIRKDMKKEFIKMEEKIEEFNLKQLKAEENKRMPLTEEEKTKTTDEPSQDLLCLSHGNQQHPVMPDPPHTESDPSISTKQCSSRSGSFSPRFVIVEEEPLSVLEQQPSQKSDRKTKKNLFENTTTKSVPKNHKLAIHLLTHTGDKPWPCVTCGQRFREEYKLKRHLRIHTKEMPIQCPTCPRKLSSGTCLKTHMRCHNGEKPWICEICEKRFRSKFSLARHQVTHTGEKTEWLDGTFVHT
ncbi:unnamed protein product [Clavelina lepadiformis]|uniref:C2H2-type domain-containing protein n=1 Tax=Clavelina lepadiformis TaxID=159417 RepID=A0ABP0GN04_CLALP